MIEHLRGEDIFRLLLEAAPDAMVIVNGEGNVVLANAQTERLFGFSSADLVDQPIEQLIPDRFHQRHAKHRQSYS